MTREEWAAVAEGSGVTITTRGEWQGVSGRISGKIDERAWVRGSLWDGHFQGSWHYRSLRIKDAS